MTQQPTEPAREREMDLEEAGEKLLEQLDAGDIEALLGEDFVPVFRSALARRRAAMVGAGEAEARTRRLVNEGIERHHLPLTINGARLFKPIISYGYAGEIANNAPALLSELTRLREQVKGFEQHCAEQAETIRTMMQEIEAEQRNVARLQRENEMLRADLATARWGPVGIEELSPRTPLAQSDRVLWIVDTVTRWFAEGTPQEYIDAGETCRHKLIDDLTIAARCTTCQRGEAELIRGQLATAEVKIKRLIERESTDSARIERQAATNNEMQKQLKDAVKQAGVEAAARATTEAENEQLKHAYREFRRCHGEWEKDLATAEARLALATALIGELDIRTQALSEYHAAGNNLCGTNRKVSEARAAFAAVMEEST
jgi:cell division protein FtsB